MTTVKPTPSDPLGPPLPGAAPSSVLRAPIDPATLFREALPSILRMARNRGLDDQAQRDVAQDVGERLTSQQARYDPTRGTPMQWAIGIAVNVIRHTRRRHGTERRFIEREPTGSMDDRPALDLTPEESARAHAALSLIGGALSDEEQEIFELKAEHHTAEQIAAVLGLTQSKVEQRIREARARLTALLKSLGEDKTSATQVRGMVLPFITVEELEAALRAGKVREGLADELWRGVLERIGHEQGRDDPTEPPEAPSPQPPGTIPPKPLARRPPTRLAPSARHLGTAAAVVVLSGALVGIATRPAMTGSDGEGRPTILAESPPAPATSLMPPSSTAAPTTATSPAFAATTAPTATANPAAPLAAAPSTDPDTMSESLLLLTATNAAPARALLLASKHAERFPSQSVGKRERIIVHALVTLGRQDQAEARARALQGTVYEKALRDTLKTAPP